jgi:pimeloyl-ACP methyl ester carboxylesterase
VSEFAQRYWDRAQAFSHDFSDPLHWSVFCSEDIPYVTERDITTGTANTFIGRYVIDEYRRACAEWPRGRIHADFRTPVTVRIPTLLLSGVLDPVTPPELAEHVSRSLPLAKHIVSPATAHGSVSGCARPAVLQFLSTGTFAGLPRVCE